MFEIALSASEVLNCFFIFILVDWEKKQHKFHSSDFFFVSEIILPFDSYLSSCKFNQPEYPTTPRTANVPCAVADPKSCLCWTHQAAQRSEIVYLDPDLDQSGFVHQTKKRWCVLAAFKCFWLLAVRVKNGLEHKALWYTHNTVLFFLKQAF